MMLYVNGDSHTAGAEAVNPHAFAEDDTSLFYLGRAPHPANLEVSWGKLLSATLKSAFHCEAESASSNDRIIRTTKEWLNNSGKDFSDLFVIIQWSTWEREEWEYDGTIYQVNGSGTDQVPPALRQKYLHYVADMNWYEKTQAAHKKIWDFHGDLSYLKIPHIFFNGNNDFSSINESVRYNWGTSYIGPYDPKLTYDSIIRSQGIDTVMPGSWHFGRDGHNAFYRFILDYIIKNKLV